MIYHAQKPPHSLRAVVLLDLGQLQPCCNHAADPAAGYTLGFQGAVFRAQLRYERGSLQLIEQTQRFNLQLVSFRLDNWSSSYVLPKVALFSASRGAAGCSVFAGFGTLAGKGEVFAAPSKGGS
jgi:hypothetical protein